jgi:DNA-binding NtrC family response regulator
MAASDGELYIDRLEIDEPLPIAVERLMGFLRRNIRVGAEMLDAERSDLFEYPTVALREAVVNSLVHMDYGLKQKSRVYVFDDRIEFYNPGGLPRGASIEKMRTTLPQHWPRNPRLCDVLQYLEKSFENLGSGIRRMTKAMTDAGLRPPDFHDDGTEFRVVFWGPANPIGRSAASVPVSKPDLSVRQTSQTEEVAGASSAKQEAPDTPAVTGNPVGIVLATESPLKDVLRRAELAAQTDYPLLIVGETGTGKEAVARYIHEVSGRAPLVHMSCAAIPDALASAELFGWEKGSFTGADRRRQGMVEQAHGGTLVLDEVESLSAQVQGSLLSVLEMRAVRPIGSSREIRADARIIAVTNRDIDGLLEEGRLRRDFFSRLSAFVLHIPPLRDRRMDIPVLAEQFLREISAQRGERARRFTPQALDMLQSLDLPGNVRELHNLVQIAALTIKGDEIAADALNRLVKEMSENYVRDAIVPFKIARQQFERRYLERLIARSGKDVRGAAKRAGLSIATLRKLLRDHKLL